MPCSHVMHPPNTLYLRSLSQGVSENSCGLIQPNLFGEVPVLVVPIHSPPEQGIWFHAFITPLGCTKDYFHSKASVGTCFALQCRNTSTSDPAADAESETALHLFARQFCQATSTHNWLAVLDCSYPNIC